MKQIQPINEEQIHKAEELLQELKSHLFPKSFFHTIREGNREHFTTKFWAFLLSPISEHQLGTFPLECLSRLVASKYGLKDSLHFSEQSKVQLEKTVGTTQKRIDIYIEDESTNIAIGLEFKINSPESKGQTISYDRHLPHCNYFLFITNNGRQAKSERFVSVTYQELYDHVLYPCAEEISKSKNYFKVFIDDYISLITNINNNFMVQNSESKKLLRSFWTNNQELILQCVELLSADTEINEEERETLEKVREALAYANSMQSKIGEQARAIFKILSGHNIDAELLDNLQDPEKSQEIFAMHGMQFPILVPLEGNANLNINSAGEINGHLRYYKKETYVFNGKEYRLCSQWYSDQTEALMDFAKKQGINIK